MFCFFAVCLNLSWIIDDFLCSLELVTLYDQVRFLTAVCLAVKSIALSSLTFCGELQLLSLASSNLSISFVATVVFLLSFVLHLPVSFPTPSQHLSASVCFHFRPFSPPMFSPLTYLGQGPLIALQAFPFAILMRLLVKSLVFTPSFSFLFTSHRRTNYAASYFKFMLCNF
jgi:hypothetical protein